MNRGMKVKIASGAVAALALAIALGAAGAVAASSILSANEDSQAVIDDAAKQLRVTPGALTDALKQGLKNRVDAVVEAGRLTEAQGKELKERIDAGDIPLVFGGFGHRSFGHFGPFGHVGHFGSLQAAASYLDVTEAALRERLQDGDTLAEVAKAEGKSVNGLVNALVAAATEKLDDAVADGRLTKERAAELKQRLEERITDLVNGESRADWFRHRGFERGFDFRFDRGPRAFQGPRA
jgi:hypothetical protein